MHNVIQPSFQQAHQRTSGIPLGTAGNIHVAAELPLVDAVVAFDLLLFPQAGAVVGELAALGNVHAWRIIRTTLDGALRRVAARALQKQLHAFAAAQPANWSSITSHGALNLSAET